MTKSVFVQDVVQELEKWAPKHLAYDWDNVGLQLGSFQQPVKNILITLDVLEEVADEAIEKDIDLIIAHHPILFKPLTQINVAEPKGKTIKKLMQHDISVFAAHTNLDVTFDGVSDMLADQLGIKNTQVLVPTTQVRYMKLVCYVPKKDVDYIKQALGDHGAGHIGNYSHSVFMQEGTGAFIPDEGASPHIGQHGIETQVEEVKLETIVPASQAEDFVSLLCEKHPYEEPVYDLIELANQGTYIGAGRIGTLDQAMNVKDLCERVKEKLQVPALRVVGDVNKQVKKVAVLGGSGEDYISQAKQMGADVYITGDLTFHQAQEAMENGIILIDPGHHVEKIMIGKIIEFITKTSLSVSCFASEVNTEPFQFM